MTIIIVYSFFFPSRILIEEIILSYSEHELLVGVRSDLLCTYLGKATRLLS